MLISNYAVNVIKILAKFGKCSTFKTAKKGDIFAI